jgi:lipoprotein NlpD
MFGVRQWGVGAVSVAVMVLAGCGSTPMNHAPVEDRNAAASKNVAVAPAVKQPPGFENAGKAGYYTIKPGDTLIRIGLETGQSHKDIARWNALENPNKIEVGQVIRVVAPVAGETAVAVAKPVAAPAATTTALPAASAPAAAPAAASSSVAPAPAASAATAAKPVAPAPAPASGGDDEVAWIWPGSGTVLAGFDEVKNKGLDIGGNAGDPVLAAGEGKVVYAGAGLRGYGNLIILKHNNTYLTAYAHNQTLLVKEDQTVKKGQKIAEMGNSDADRVKLHFEVRRQGKPVDPAKYLPAR